MRLSTLDIAIICAYLIVIALIGVVIKNKATKNSDSFFLADRNIPWWLLGFAGCSSYIDIGGTMSMVGAMYYLGLKSVWMTHIFWGWVTMAFFMAYQAKWIRRSGVMTFAEWNTTRFGNGKDAEWARLAAAIFLLVLIIFNLMYVAVGVSKFSEQFLPMPAWEATLIVFFVVGIYVTLGGCFGVIITDAFQTALMTAGAFILAAMALQFGSFFDFGAVKNPGWSSLAPTWHLWSGYLKDTPASYSHFYLFGPIMMAGFCWLAFRVLAGPNVWDFQFFLTLKSPRDASLAAGTWTVGYTIRWIMACAFMMLGIKYIGSHGGFDAEKIMPAVILKFSSGMRGLFLGVLLAALMSTVSAIVNVTSSVVVNDFLKRYITKNVSEKKLVRMGQIASAIALLVGFLISLAFNNIISAWETMIFVVVTMILAPATMRWHWWRFGAKAFVWSMVVSALICIAQKVFFGYLSVATSLAAVSIACFIATVIIGFLNKPADMDVLVKFYAKVRPFGFWGPVRQEAVKQGLVPKRDKMPAMDALNGFLCSIFQMAIAFACFCVFLKKWPLVGAFCGVTAIMSFVLYFTWYKNLPSKDEL